MAKDQIYPAMKYFCDACFNDVGFDEAVEGFCNEKDNTLIDIKNEITALLKKNDYDLWMILRMIYAVSRSIILRFFPLRSTV